MRLLRAVVLAHAGLLTGSATGQTAVAKPLAQTRALPRLLVLPVHAHAHAHRSKGTLARSDTGGGARAHTPRIKQLLKKDYSAHGCRCYAAMSTNEHCG